MQDKYVPFERPERPQDPPEPPTIPEGISGYYNEFSDEFVADDEAFEAALEDWDLMPYQRQQLLKRFLVDLFYKDWKRIEGD